MTKYRTKQEIVYRPVCSSFKANIPAGTPVRKASNLPGDFPGYWAENWEGMSEQEQSWGRSYGFWIGEDEVEAVPEEPSDTVEEEDEHPVWQLFMDRAHDVREEGEPRKEWLSRLGKLSSFAINFGNFNYQVENGGLYQWVTNGLPADGTLKAMFVQLNDLRGYMSTREEFGEDVHEAVDHVRRCLLCVKEHFKPDAEYKGCFGDYMLSKSERAEEYMADEFEEGNFDELYYTVHQKPFMRVVEAYLSASIGPHA